MTRFLALVLICLLISGCSGMTASIGYANDDYFLRPRTYDYYDVYFVDRIGYNDCPRYYLSRPINCAACHYTY